MKFLIAIAIISFIAIIGSRITFLKRRLPIGFENILFTGIEYIFIGAILGTSGLNIIDLESIKLLEPFLLFGLCWIGFLFGLQFEIRLLKSLPRFYFSITVIQALITCTIVTVMMAALLHYFLDISGSVLLMLATAFGCIAACTAQSALAIVSRRYQVQNRGLLELMRYISSVDGIIALFIFTIVLSFYRGSGDETILRNSIFTWVTISLSMGIIPAVILIILSKTKFSQQEFIVFVIGIMLFCAGLSHHLNHTPLISGLICGIIVANFCRHRIRALSTVVLAEKSIYIFLLIIIGAGWQFNFDATLILALVYCLIRAFSKIVGAFIGTRIFKPQYNVPRTVGLGLLSEGGLAIAIVLTYQQLQAEYSGFLISLLIISVVINELISPKLILMQFQKDEQPPTLR